MGKKKQLKKLAAKNDDLEQQVADLESEIAKVTAKLDKAKTKVEKWKSRAADARRAADEEPSTEERETPAETKDQQKHETGDAVPAEVERALEIAAEETPNASWSVSRLREEMRRRGLTGHSRSPKDRLLAALTDAT